MPPDKDSILTVRELTRTIKSRLESDRSLQQVWVRGEISNFKHHSSGHMYFTLKDQASLIRSVMFASHNRQLGFVPREGANVLAAGSVSVYDRDGQYQFYVTQLQPDGIGSLFLAFEQLKKKLDAEGLFALERKRPIPYFPRTVGVLTSATGAAVRDMVTTLRRRSPSVSIIVCPIHVQGQQAAPSIVRALELMNRERAADVLIVGRGGGALEELWAFNEERVARAIAASAIPVISAVGHETDFTIADFVADLRAATPTAAAELAAPHQAELGAQLAQLSRRLEQGLRRLIDRQTERLRRLKDSPALAMPERQLLQPAERLDRLQEQLRRQLQQRAASSRQRLAHLAQTLAALTPSRRAGYEQQRLDALRQNLLRAAATRTQRATLHWQAAVRQLDALSPLKVMQRGYSLTYNESKTELIRSIRQVQPGDSLKIQLSDGQLDCQVWAMEGVAEDE